MRRPYIPGKGRRWSDVLPHAETKIAINRARLATDRLVDLLGEGVDRLERLERQTAERMAEREREARAKRLERRR